MSLQERVITRRQVINGKTYYQILGVLEDAEDVVVKAAYRSLSMKYHPDKWTGDKEVANQRMSEINVAYETLSDSLKRNAYDREFNLGHSDSRFHDLGEATNFDEYFHESESDWEYAVDYFPEADELFRRLRSLDPYLALAYRQRLLASRKFDAAKQIYTHLKSQYLERFFGSHLLTQKVVENLMMKGRRDVAAELNKAIRIMGSSVKPPLLIKKILDKFALRENSVDLFVEAIEKKTFQSFKDAFDYINYDLSVGTNLLGGEVFKVCSRYQPNTKVEVRSAGELEKLLDVKVSEWLRPSS